MRTGLQYAVGRAVTTARHEPDAPVRERNQPVASNSPTPATPSGPPARTREQIQADLAATRSRLVSSVETLIDTVHPNRIKQRTIANAKQLANEELENAKSLVFNARGDLRTKRLLAVAGAIAGAVSFLIILRRLARRSQRG
jgi:hypothetical protein